MQARFFDEKNICGLCARRCYIPKGKRGFCGVRENRNGSLVSLTYGRVAAAAVDPIEKKPLFHFMPGSLTCSISSFGCNFTCRHCQNYQISQCRTPESEPAEPDDVIQAARSAGAQSVSFTYNEPTVCYEFMYDVACAAKHAGLATAMVTNGYLSEEALRDIAPVMDAVRVDLKAFSDRFYRDVCGGAHLTPVLDTISLTRELKRHLELVTLIIPGYNDSKEEIDAMLAWETAALGRAVPHHFTGFFPMYHMKDVRPASAADLSRVLSQARDAGLYYAYAGNLPVAGGEDTICPACGNLLIERNGYRTRIAGMEENRCARCGRVIEGVFE